MSLSQRWRNHTLKLTLHQSISAFRLVSFFVFVFVSTASIARANADNNKEHDGPSTSSYDSLPAKIPLVDGEDVQFRKLSRVAGLSQTRVSLIVQDKLGFMWFGTQYGLNRYDGYKTKVFKHESGQPDSLSCAYIRSLFVDHSGALWIGCDRFLDKFLPLTETFAHYQIDTQPNQLAAPIERITQDRAGQLWLATDKGLYRFDPASGHAIRYTHKPNDKGSIRENQVNFIGGGRGGNLWLSGKTGLDEFDPIQGKVIRNIPFRSWVGQTHEDMHGTFWVTSISPQCPIATLDLRNDAITCHVLDFRVEGKIFPVSISNILESRDGTLWLGSSLGLLKLDRLNKRFIRYHNHPSDNESIESDSVISLYQDAEGNIWTCLQETGPAYFSERPQLFQNFTFRRGSLADPLVTSIYEDHSGILWVGSMGGLNRIDRKAGKNIIPPGVGVGSEIMSTLEDNSGVLVAGTFHQGLQRLDRTTGKLSPYMRNNKHSHIVPSPILRLMFDHRGSLWAATYGGISYLDRTTGKFVTHTPEKDNTIQYNEIKEDSVGHFWLGGQSGLHRFDPHTGKFVVYEHNPDDVLSLSDNRVNSIHFDQSHNLWVGTQNGLDKFDPDTRTFKTYFDRDGLAGNVVSCILEDKTGSLWMSTNNGVSSFNLQSKEFKNYSAADGLPGNDLSGWGACYQSPAGEMFFGGFSGATAFFPRKLVSDGFVPRTVLTDFRLFGNLVPIGSGSVLKRSITYIPSITLSHQQNIFSIEFSALSYFNSETNRYRYRLDGLDHQWHEVGGEQRMAHYTTLPAGTYTFHVQSATSRGAWSEPGVQLRINVLPAWYQTLWFFALCATSMLLLLWVVYTIRLIQLEGELSRAFEVRFNERNRIARELHDTLLQSFQGLILQFQTARNILPGRTLEAIETLDNALDGAEEAIVEGRDAIYELRSAVPAGRTLAEEITSLGRQVHAQAASNMQHVDFHVATEGTSRILQSKVQTDISRIVGEGLRNAFTHSNAQTIRVTIAYSDQELRVEVRDNGDGIDPVRHVWAQSTGHWGLKGMNERATCVGGELDVRSTRGIGTTIQLSIPAIIAYETVSSSKSLLLWWSRKRGKQRPSVR